MIDTKMNMTKCNVCNNLFNQVDLTNGMCVECFEVYMYDRDLLAFSVNNRS